MRVQVGCEFLYQAEVATHAVVQVEPRLDGQVRALDERWTNEPQIGMSRYLDGFGNVCRRTTISLRSTARRPGSAASGGASCGSATVSPSPRLRRPLPEIADEPRQRHSPQRGRSLRR